MKSDRRHDLAENALAKWLAEFLEGIKPYKNHIYWTIIIILLGFCAFSAWSYVAKEGQKKAWNQYLLVLNQGKLEDLEKLSGDYTSGEIAVRIRLSLGEAYLNEGATLLQFNQAGSTEKLERALGYFSEARKLAHVDPLLTQEIYYGLAQTYESLAIAQSGQDHYAQAVEMFETLLKDYPKGIYTEEAQRRLAMLKHPSTERFVAYLQARPKPSEENVTSGGGSGTDMPFDPFDPVLSDPTRSFEMPEGLLSSPEFDLPPTTDLPESDLAPDSPVLPGFDFGNVDAPDLDEPIGPAVP